MASGSGAHRGLWVALVAVMLATAVVVPVRIAYKQHQTVAAKPNRVAIVNFEFAPAVLTVRAGTKVTFTNSDGAVHTATASDQSFDSGRLAQGQSFSATVSKRVAYHCDIHQYMTAQIKVVG